MNPIYTITTVRAALAAGSRSVGYFYDLQTAKEAVEENDLDICECGYYKYAVIEEVYQGLYTYTFERKEHWYVWNNEKEQYVPCEKPERFKNTYGWSLG